MIKRISSFLKRPFVWFKKTRRRNKVFSISGLLILAVTIVILIGTASAQPMYTIQPVKRGNITQTISETGFIHSTGQTDVYSPATGIVTKVFIENGQNVVLGQELFTVNSTATEQQKAKASSDYLAAKAKLDDEKANLFVRQSTMLSEWDTFKELAEGDTYENSDGSPKYDNRALPEFHIAEKDWLAAEAKYKNQQTVVYQAQAALTSAYHLYLATQNATVKATIDGEVRNLSVFPNDTIVAKDSTTVSIKPALSILSGNDTNLVTVSFNEVDIPKIKEGQNVHVSLDAIGDKTFDGKVLRVDSIGTNTQGVITYDVVISLSQAHPDIRHGMTADVDITVSEKKNILVVPNSAIKPYKGKKAVQVLDKKTGKPTYIPVTVGIRNLEKTEIIRGVEEGTKIITGAKNEKQ